MSDGDQGEEGMKGTRKFIMSSSEMEKSIFLVSIIKKQRQLGVQRNGPW